MSEEMEFPVCCMAAPSETRLVDSIIFEHDLSVVGTIRVTYISSEELGILLDSVQREAGDLDKIRWVPYHLQFVLRRFGGTGFAHKRLAEKLSEYCKLMKDANELSGEGWEGLFVLFLVARCLNRKSYKTSVPDLSFATRKLRLFLIATTQP